MKQTSFGGFKSGKDYFGVVAAPDYPKLVRFVGEDSFTAAISDGRGCQVAIAFEPLHFDVRRVHGFPPAIPAMAQRRLCAGLLTTRFRLPPAWVNRHPPTG